MTLEFDLKVTDTGNFLNTAASVRTLSLTIGTPFDHTEVIDNDDVDEPDGTITATLLFKNPRTYGIGAKHQVSVDISDDEATPEFTITAANPSIVEGTDTDETKYKTYDFNVMLNRQSMSDITVEFDIGAEGDTALAGADKDYTHTYDTQEKRKLTFTGATTSLAGETIKTITVIIVADALNEANESFTVTLKSPTNASFAGSDLTISAMGEITNDDAVPSISFDSATAENTEGMEIGFPVSLSAPSGRDITVSYTLTDGTTTSAGMDKDYTNPVKAARTLTIPAGDATGTITVNTEEDSVPEADENFTITLDEPTDLTIVTLGAISEATGTILSNDKLVFTISGMNVAEGDDPNSENVNIEFEIAISAGATENETIRYSTSDGPAPSGGAAAKAGSDYTATSGSHEFVAGGDRTHTVSVPISEDTLYEFDESFTMTLSGNDTSDTEILVSSATVTIENDDPFLASTIVVVAKNNGYVTEGNAVEFEFTADPELAQNLEVNISHLQVGDYLMDIPASTITIPANTSLTIKHTETYQTNSNIGTIQRDGSVTLTIEDYVPSGAGDVVKYTADGTNGSAKMRIEDADTPPGVSIIAFSSEVTEGETAQFEIKSDVASTEARSVNISIDEGTADFIASADKGDHSITIPANDRAFILDIPVIDDSAPEQHGNITVAIEDPSPSPAFNYTKSAKSSVTIAVIDNDTPTGGISIATISSPVIEAANTYAVFQVISDTIDNANDRIIEVRVENATGDNFIDLANQDAIYKFDPSDNTFEVTIPTGARYGLLRVKIHDDSRNETNGAIMATIVTNPAQTHNTASIAIHDDDADVPIISISSGAEDTGVTEGYQFTFEVESDRDLNGNDLEIKFDITDGGTGAMINGIKFTIPGNSRTAIGTVTMPTADVTSAGANIIIKVVETTTYDVSADDPSLTVAVKDNDAPSTTTPSMSISSANYVADGEKIEFTITASDIPTSSTDVKVMLSGDISYLDDGQKHQVDVTLNGVQEKKFEVATKGNSASSNHGIITATILDGNGYVRPNTAAENETSIVVVDDLPVISIADISKVNKSVGTFIFTLTSDSSAIAGYPINIHTLSVDDSNTSSPQYYASHVPNSNIEITHLSTNNAVEISVTLTADTTSYQGWGELSISLANGADYIADTNANSRKVTIIDDQTAPISVAVTARGSAVEGTTFFVTFTATGAFPAGGSIEVVPTINEMGSTTGYYGSHTPQLVTLSADNTSDSIAITLPDNSHTEANGEITISIARGDGFEVHTTDHTKMVMLLDDESLPKISVTAIDTTIDEGQDAVFKLTTTGTLTNPLDVFVSVDDGSENFLTTTHARKTETIPTTGTIRIPYTTEADTNVESDGTITITVLADDRDIIEYLIDTAIVETSSASVSVIDNDDTSLPSITIAGDQTSIIEGDVASFTLTATDPVSARLSVLVEVVETNSGTGDFFAGSSNKYTPERISISETTKTGQIELPTIRDADDEDDGSISVRIKTDDLATKTYSVGVTHIASITVVDDDDAALPKLSITLKDPSKTSITEGDPNPIFTITSTGGTVGDTLEFDLDVSETANFLNTAANVRTLSLTIGTPYDHTEVINDDDVDENDGTILATLKLRDPQTYSIGEVHQISVDISDDDGVPKVSIIANVSVKETDSDFSSAVAVTLSRASTNTITVPFTVNAGTADESDYTVADSAIRQLVFSPDPATKITPTTLDIPFSIIGDNVGEKTEQFTITLGAPDNADISGENITSTITIIDDEAPVLSIEKLEGDNPAVTEADQVIVMFPIISSFKTDKITVYYTPSQTGNFLGGGLIADTPTSIELDFADGTTAILPVPIANDDLDEPDGSISIKLENDGRMENGQPVITYSIDESLENSGTVKIVDDDSLPIISIVADNGDVAESTGSAKFMLTATGFNNDSNLPLSINATPAEDGSDFLTDSIADIATDFSVEFSDIDGDNIFTGEIEVTLDDDKTGEPTGDIKLILNSDPNSANTYQLGETTEGVITILDDDAPELSITAGSSVTEGESDFVEFTIFTKVSPNKPVTIYYDLAESGDVINDEISTGRGKTAELDFTNGSTEATLPIAIVDDDTDEVNSTITVTLIEDIAPISYTVHPSPNDSEDIEVIDDDDTPQIIISTSTPTIEEGASAIFELTATPEGSITPQQPVTVEFDVVQEGDFLLWRVPQTYIMDSTSATITLTTHDDNSEETEGGSITLSLVDSTRYVTSENSDKNSAKVTITDNDTPTNGQQQEPEEPRISVAEVAVNTILNDVLGQINTNPASGESETPLTYQSKYSNSFS